MLASVWVGIGGARRSTSSRRRKRLWGDGAAAARTYLRARPTGTSNQKGRSMAVMEVRGLTKRFGPVLAGDRLSFEVDRGTVVGFLGPNGAGKTTTLRALLGLVRPTAGTATIHGRAYGDLPDPLRHVGAVLEASSFYPSRRARNHLRVQADRKSTRLNSSHPSISYAVFCLKKKKNHHNSYVSNTNKDQRQATQI